VSKLKSDVDELRTRFEEIEKQLNSLDQDSFVKEISDQERIAELSNDQNIINDAEKRKNAFVRFGKSEPGIKSKQNSFVRFGRPGAMSRLFGHEETIEKRKNAFVY